MTDALREEARRRFPDGEWTVRTLSWAEGGRQRQAFHTVDVADPDGEGVAVRRVVEPDGSGGFEETVRLVDTRDILSVNRSTPGDNTRIMANHDPEPDGGPAEEESYSDGAALASALRGLADEIDGGDG